MAIQVIEVVATQVAAGGGPYRPGVAIRWRCGAAARHRRGIGTLFDLFGRVLFVKPSRQRQPEPSATRGKNELVICYSVKIDPFCAVSRWGWEVSDFGAFDFYSLPTVVAAQARRPTIAKPGHVLLCLVAGQMGC